MGQRVVSAEWLHFPWHSDSFVIGNLATVYFNEAITSANQYTRGFNRLTPLTSHLGCKCTLCITIPLSCLSCVPPLSDADFPSCSSNRIYTRSFFYVTSRRKAVAHCVLKSPADHSLLWQPNWLTPTPISHPSLSFFYTLLPPALPWRCGSAVARSHREAETPNRWPQAVPQITWPRAHYKHWRFQRGASKNGAASKKVLLLVEITLKTLSRGRVNNPRLMHQSPYVGSSCWPFWPRTGNIN